MKIKHSTFPEIKLWLCGLLFVSLLFSGCNSAQVYLPELIRGTIQVGQMGQRLVARNPTANAAATVSAENRLLVIGVDGNVYTIDPDGRNALALTNDASESVQYVQPTWSASGEWIAWSQILLDGERVRSALQLSRYDGSQRNELEVAYAPFYIYWSPAEDKLVYLSNWISGGQQSIALRLVEVNEATSKNVTLAQGSPFYFSWAPDGTQLLSHVGNERLELQSLQQESTALEATPALFAAPQWSADGQSLFYAVLEAKANKERLVQANTSGTELATLLEFDGRITFAISPDGKRLAYVLSDPFAAINALGPLSLIDLESGDTTEVSDQQVVAFSWSPDSQKLAYLEVEEVNSELGTRWHLWQDGESRAFTFFLPSTVFLNSYLPFFDQYSRSTSIWSPDSSAFTYAGMHENQIAGVWVQNVDGNDEPFYVATGVFATWSPR